LSDAITILVATPLVSGDGTEVGMGAEVGVGVAAEVDVREAVGAEVGEGDRKIAELGVVPAPEQPPVANTAATNSPRIEAP
jgi:hypothetical protein